jgi:hypothetical protein
VVKGGSARVDPPFSVKAATSVAHEEFDEVAISNARVPVMALVALGVTVEQQSTTFDLNPSSTQFTVLWDFTQAGTLRVDWVDTAGVAHQIDQQAVTANVADMVTYFGNPGTVRVRFTPSAQPVTGRVEITYSGHASVAS